MISTEQITVRIDELIQLKTQFLAEISTTKESLENLEANVHALNGGIAELRRLCEAEKKEATKASQEAANG